MIFIDSNIFISYYNVDDQNNKLAIKIIKDIEQKKYGEPITSDYIFDETMTVTLLRTKNKKRTIELGLYILKSNIKFLKVEKEIFKKAWNLFCNSNFKMSFTDFTNQAFLEKFDIKNIATFDREFKKIKNINIIDN